MILRMAMYFAGRAGSEEKAEPNLIPLLDLVLQMVMFFIMVANFSENENNREVQLPLAQSAQPRDKKNSDTVILSVDQMGRVLGLRDRPLTKPVEIQSALADKYELAMEDARRKGLKEPKTRVVIRGDRRANFKEIWEVMREVRAAHFKSMELRASIQN